MFDINDGDWIGVSLTESERSELSKFLIEHSHSKDNVMIASSIHSGIGRNLVVRCGDIQKDITDYRSW